MSPLVVLVTGQSNATIERSFTWSPPTNLKVWNYAKVSGDVGTEFLPPSGGVMSLALSFGEALANDNPEREIYIINIALGGNTIGGWLPSVVSPDRDVYSDIVANVPPALSAIGVDRIDAYVWWQGEGDAGLIDAYPAKFEQMIARMRANSWFPPETPTVIFGCTSKAISGVTAYDNMNVCLQGLIETDPQRRLYVLTSCLPASLWNDSPKLHMTAAGYRAAGRLGANAMSGRSRGLVMSKGFIEVEARGSVSAGEVTYTGAHVMRWSRVEDIVSFRAVVVWTAHTGTGALVIGPLPFVPVASDAVAIYASNLMFSGQLAARINPGSTDIQIVQMTGGSGSTMVPVDTAATVVVSGSFEV